MELGRICVASLVLTLIAYGLSGVFHPAGENACEMTYMWENPEYLEVELGEWSKKFPHYSLFFYGEGARTRNFRSNSKRMDGIPCLFLPGNAGSHRQVRSLASVALRMAEQERKAQFDWFSIDFNEEMSGIYGASLASQAGFASHCVRHILTLYSHLPASKMPSSVLVVGHSMGGLVARALFTTGLLPQNSIRTIITLATPHQHPALPLDHHLLSFYTTLNQFWRDNMQSSILSDVVIVSISGGLRDALIPAILTPLTGIAASNSSISKVMTTVPHVWVTTDHLAVLWCRQLVLQLTRAMIQLVDQNTRQIVGHAERRHRVLSEHLTSCPPVLHRMIKGNLSDIELASSRVWFHSEKSTAKGTSFAAVASSGKVFTLVTNVYRAAQLVKCNVLGNSTCTEASVISDEAVVSSQVLPPLYSSIQIVRVNLSRLQESHVVFQMPKRSKTKGEQKVFASFQVSDEPQVKNLTVSIVTGDSQVTLDDFQLHHTVRVLGLVEPWQAYMADIRLVGCDGHAPTVKKMAVMISSNISGYAQESPLHATLDVAAGASLSYSLQLQTLAHASDDMNLLISSQLPCSWMISVTPDWHNILVQFCRNYVTSSFLLLKLALLTVELPMVGLAMSMTYQGFDILWGITLLQLPQFIAGSLSWVVPTLFLVAWSLVACMLTLQGMAISLAHRPHACFLTCSHAYLQSFICYNVRPMALLRCIGNFFLFKNGATASYILTILSLVASTAIPAVSCPSMCRVFVWWSFACYSISMKGPQRNIQWILLVLACSVLLQAPALIFWFKSCIESSSLVLLSDNSEWLKAALTSALIHAGWLSPPLHSVLLISVFLNLNTFKASQSLSLEIFGHAINSRFVPVQPSTGIQYYVIILILVLISLV